MFPVTSILATNILPGLGPLAPTEVSNLVVLDLSADNLVALSGGGNPGTAITTRFARFTTVGSPNDSASLPKSVAGLAITVRNDAAVNAMNVFPAGTETVNGGASFSITAGRETTFRCYTRGAWFCALSN